MSKNAQRTFGALIGAAIAGFVLAVFLEAPPAPLLGADPMPAGGTAGLYLVDAAADLADLDPNDDDVVILGLRSDGGMLLYDNTATDTVDNANIYNGPNSVGRFIRFGNANSTSYYDMGSQGGAVTLDWSTYSIIAVDLNLNTTFTFTAPASPRWLTLVLTQLAPGGRTVTWPTILGTTPVLDGAVGGITVVYLFFDGTNYHFF